jgi:hypothetical protein
MRLARIIALPLPASLLQTTAIFFPGRIVRPINIYLLNHIRKNLLAL